MGKYFGTDGFRGKAGVDLTAEHAFKIGRFIGKYFKGDGNKRPKIVIGKDTRLSSYMLEYAIAAGITSSGADAYMLHVTSTPSVSFVTANDDFDCGIMISASHNPFYDNGIKVINSNGEKISDEFIEKIENYIENELDAYTMHQTLPYAVDENVGRIIDYSEGRNRYIGYLISISKYSFKGYSVGLDCANGSAWMIAKSVFEALGAKVYAIGVSPNGTNINMDSGSTNIDILSKYVIKNGLDMGFAFDGDADRCIAVDESGDVINGDHILYLLSRRLKATDELAYNTVVTTVMSNLGLYKALDELGIQYESTNVGDRYVYERMQNEGYTLGGEQSGHIIMSKYATTGDGILTAIKIMETAVGSKTTLSKLVKEVRMFPQLTVNVRVKDKGAAMNNEELKGLIAATESELAGNGRILVRPSGTEPVIRIMVETSDESLCKKYAKAVKEKIISLDLSDGEKS